MGNINLNITHAQLFAPYAVKVDTEIYELLTFSAQCQWVTPFKGENKVYKALGTVRFKEIGIKDPTKLCENCQRRQPLYLLLLRDPPSSFKMSSSTVRTKKL